MSNQKKLFLISALLFFFGLLLFTFIGKNKPVNLAYITNQGENTVSVIDLNKLTIQKKISVGKSPLGIAIIKNKAIAVVGNIDSQSLSIIDLKKNQVQKTVALKTAPLGMVVHPSEDKILITSWYENKVIILSTKDFTITDKINVGITPSGIAFNMKYN